MERSFGEIISVRKKGVHLYRRFDMITKNTNLQVDMAILYKIKAYKKILVIYMFKICTQLGVNGLCNANRKIVY